MKTITQFINESLKRTKVNILVGRFQPFTNGHLKCIQNVYKKSWSQNCDLYG